jgi:APA family basic amino acid/polyamine antiporter
MTQPPTDDAGRALRREVGVFGAVMMGLGSIVGTGVFVSIGIAAGVAGPSVLLAIAVAGVVAACNALSSAQLAANHPVSGGTYEYGYRWLHPALGFTAGWMFLCAKSASAATAALGFAGYALSAFGRDASAARVPLAVGAVALLTVLVLSGIRRTSRANAAVVSVTLLALLFFVIAGLPAALRTGREHLTPFFAPVASAASDAAPLPGLLEACALMFVAYTGYGRIATLGEEIRDPRQNIPRAIVATLLASMALYGAVGFVGVAAAGPDGLADATAGRAAPLAVVAGRFDVPMAGAVVALGAVTAMLGVLLNLILGLSRVILAMGRRGDIPGVFARLDRGGTTPSAAVLLVGAAAGGLVLIGDVKTTWSFSAFTVLVYYAVTNLAATRLKEGERLYPRFIPWLGLAACLFLAFWVEPVIWLTGLGLIAAGLLWQWAMRKLAGTGRAFREPR